MFNSGDIVVRKWSKAKTLKNKVFKVIDKVDPNMNSWDNKYRVITPTGRIIELGEWRLQLLSSAVNQKETEYYIAKKASDDKQKACIKLRKDASLVNSYFPKI